jgi:DNA-binding transcriptional regulator YiaG
MSELICYLFVTSIIKQRELIKFSENEERRNMPNVATVLKDEITRLARKELRSQTQWMKKTTAQYRRDIVMLKRQVAQLQRQVSRSGEPVPKKSATPADDDNATRVRFTAKGLRSQRLRLGLSAGNFARLVGVTPKSIYDWERGVSRPRKRHLSALASLRAIGKKEARTRLEQLDTPQSSSADKS